MKKSALLLVVILLVIVLACLGTSAAASQAGSGIADVFQADAIRQQAKANKEMAEALQTQAVTGTISQVIQLASVGFGFIAGMIAFLLGIALVIAILYLYFKHCKTNALQAGFSTANYQTQLGQPNSYIGLPSGQTIFPYPVETIPDKQAKAKSPDDLFTGW